LANLALRLEHIAIWLENWLEMPYFSMEDDDIFHVAKELREIGKLLRGINGKEQKGGENDVNLDTA